MASNPRHRDMLRRLAAHTGHAVDHLETHAMLHGHAELRATGGPHPTDVIASYREALAAGRTDMEWAREHLLEHGLPGLCHFHGVPDAE